MRTSVRETLKHEEAKQLIHETAEKLGITPRQLIERSSDVIGTATWVEFRTTGFVPLWLESHCNTLLNNRRPKAKNLLSGAVVIDLESDVHMAL